MHARSFKSGEFLRARIAHAHRPPRVLLPAILGIAVSASGCIQATLIGPATPTASNATTTSGLEVSSYLDSMLDGTQNVAPGSTASFTFQSGSSYVVSQTVQGTCPAGSWNGNTYTTAAITSNCAVSFSALPTYPVTPSADANLTLSPAPVQMVAIGSTASITVTAATGYFVSTTVGGTCSSGSWSGSVYTTGPVTGNCTVSFSSSPLDPYWSNVVLLLHMDGAEGGTTFTDVVGHAVTANGSAHITTAASKFGGSSALFDGSSAYLSIPYQADWAVGDSAFTFEGWFNVLNESGGCGAGTIFTQGPSGGSGSSYWFGFCGDGGQVAAYAEDSGAGWQYANGTGNPGIMSDGFWHHVAWVRQSGSDDIDTYVDGALAETTTLPAGNTSLYDSTLPFLIGAQSGPGTLYHGYMDELRITNGVARYTSGFTPPTAPFPNDY